MEYFLAVPHRYACRGVAGLWSQDQSRPKALADCSGNLANLGNVRCYDSLLRVGPSSAEYALYGVWLVLFSAIRGYCPGNLNAPRPAGPVLPAPAGRGKGELTP